MIGKTLAHYEITLLLGKGGMGEVYQAKDRKLGRDVAIKVLSEEFAKDADRVVRFQREAKLLASLNHPNIATIHGLEESDEAGFLVLELVEGETLADRLKRGPIPVEESLKLALQIAEALEAAHEKGVIHRDLKPANIKITPEDKVKVLDFGLAKAFADEQADLNLTNSPTLSIAATQQGIILGTAAYMSPEQASGKSIDKRADIWAFGVVLFEMLAGQSLFAGDNVSQTLARVIERQPDFSMLPANLHPKVGELLKRCLQKESKNRYHDIADIRLDLQEVLLDPGGVLVQPVAVAEPRKKLRALLQWATITLILTIIAGAAVWILKPVPPAEPRPVARFEYNLPEGQYFNAPSVNSIVAVSPDGSRFTYSTTDGLYLRKINELKAKLIPGTDEDPQSPFFSPDGQWIGYWSAEDEKLKKIALGGGASVTLCDAGLVLGAIWYPDDTILYSEVLEGGVRRVSANGGTPEILAEGLTYVPQLLLDGKTLLFTSVEASGAQAVVQSLGSGERKTLFAGAAARYFPTGHIVYDLNNNLFAVPFDLETLEIAGGPVPVVEGVMRYVVSRSGTLVYVAPPKSTVLSGDAATPQRILAWVDRKGNEESLAAESNGYFSVKISPDGTRVAFSAETGAKRDVWILDIARNTPTRLTFEGTNSEYPIWTPDGKHIVFYSSRENQIIGDAIYRKAADGTGEIEKLFSTADIRVPFPSSWSGDGSTLILSELAISSLGGDIGALSMGGDNEWKALLQEKYSEFDPQISPDGKWMAYQSNESGQWEVYVRPFPEVTTGRWQISTSGGVCPLWSPDSRELFYRNGDDVMAVAVETAPAFKPGNPEKLFQGQYYYGSVLDWDLALDLSLNSWDISPDGKRFLMIKSTEQAAGTSALGEAEEEIPRQIIVVLNWIEELKERVPGNP